MLGYRQGPLQLHISRVGQQLLLIIFIYLKVANVALSFLNASSSTQFTFSKILSRILDFSHRNFILFLLSCIH